ncbi:KGK domain-containing protein [Calothrix sp. UHCC 0171]|uniref:KGK domain-containing protein n=1 Tax=Calothrix sp. UHCC 0171 TaxID=3110245 RepID=UPI002B1FEC73|nr:KGK domain-containing protein [Calothrix sp. UHCC 0171]MEA5569609.1 KGK domain-containing protein [Calothrix sp. UHCC 0171]
MLTNSESNKFIVLDNNDVLLFLKDTYTVDRFKQLLLENIRSKFKTEIYKSYYVKDIFKGISINGTFLKCGNMLWNSSANGIDCQLLKIGSKGWQSGRLTVSYSIEIIPPKSHKEHDKLSIDLALDFCANDAKELESPLDDLREIILSEKKH